MALAGSDLSSASGGSKARHTVSAESSLNRAGARITQVVASQQRRGKRGGAEGVVVAVAIAGATDHGQLHDSPATIHIFKIPCLTWRHRAWAP